MNAALRVCASCEWIFIGDGGCPKCGFASYSAFYTYGKKAYRYRITQGPWKLKKLCRYESELDKEIAQSLEPPKPKEIKF